MEVPEQVAVVLNLLRSGEVTTRSDLSRNSGLGRNVVTQSLGRLSAAGLITDGLAVPSTGGRAPKGAALNADAGCILAVEVGVTSFNVAVADLTGALLERAAHAADVADGPHVVLPQIRRAMDLLMATRAEPVWGVGVGIPGPVEFGLGRPVSPPIMPGWDGFDIRGFFCEAYGAPTWVDNEVNLMALGEQWDGAARDVEDFIYVKVGTGIGAGIVSRGRLHRGEQGCAGDIGHMPSPGSAVPCRCGQRGCLEAVAGGAALAKLGREGAQSGKIPSLTKVAAKGVAIEARDVGIQALHGDFECIRIVQDSARTVGEALAGIINFFNPSLLLLGGGVLNIGDLYLAQVRQIILQRSLPLATRTLRIEVSPMGELAGLTGAAVMVADELFSMSCLPRWFSHGSPAGLGRLLHT